jgi:menaquinone-9 beta-reductase
MHEVIVVGAGPAGSTVAALLSQRGYDVLLLDKDRFPRDKICGDGLGSRALTMIDRVGVDLTQAKQDHHTWSQIRLVSPSCHVVEQNGHHGLIMPRKAFDHLMWKFALQDGARYRQMRVTSAILQDGFVRGVSGYADAGHVAYHAKVVIAADGANSTIAKSLQLVRGRDNIGVAIRGYFSGIQVVEHQIEFYLTPQRLPGYGWIFPTSGTTANVGVGVKWSDLQRMGSSVKQIFRNFIRHPLVAPRISESSLIGSPSGGMLPLYSNKLRRAYNGVLFIGDAGAFVSPLTGEGIHNAMASGSLAAEVVANALEINDTSYQTLVNFDLKCRQTFGKRLLVESLLAKLFKWPSLIDLTFSWFAKQAASVPKR